MTDDDGNPVPTDVTVLDRIKNVVLTVILFNIFRMRSYTWTQYYRIYKFICYRSWYFINSNGNRGDAEICLEATDHKNILSHFGVDRI